VSTAADAYLEAQVLTASPVKLHLLVIDGGIRAALRARSAILASNWEQMNLQPGQKLAIVVRGQIIALVPEVPVNQLRGFINGINTTGLREKEDRL